MNVSTRTKRVTLMSLAAPCYVGAAFVALMVAEHHWQRPAGGPAPPEAPLWMALPFIAVQYIGVLCWFFGPLLEGLAVLGLAWQLWRVGIKELGVLTVLGVLGGGAAWIVSVPFFVDSLKW